MSFNIIKYNRYYFNTIYFRDEGNLIINIRIKTRFFNSHDIKPDFLVITSIILVLDLILDRGYNVSYSEWYSINRIIISIIFYNILIKCNIELFIKAL